VDQPNQYKERTSKALSGYWAVIAHLAILAAAIACFISPNLDSLGGVLLLVFVFFFWGYTKVVAGEAKNIVLSGSYKSTLRSPGFYWIHPLASTQKISIKSNTLLIKPVRLTDKGGRKIEMESVVFWKVGDTSLASFLLEDHQSLVPAQARLALQKLASLYHYDHAKDPLAVTLRQEPSVINKVFFKELAERLESKGILVEDARVLQVYQLPEQEVIQREKELMQYFFRLQHDSAIASVDTADKVLKKLSSKKLASFNDAEKQQFAADFILAMVNKHSGKKFLSEGSMEHQQEKN